MEVNIHHAKTHLSRLIAAVEDGEEVIIARNGKPAVKLVRATQKPSGRASMIGRGIGQLGFTADILDSPSGDEMADLFEDMSDFE